MEDIAKLTAWRAPMNMKTSYGTGYRKEGGGSRQVNGVACTDESEKLRIELDIGRRMEDVAKLTAWRAPMYLNDSDRLATVSSDLQS